MTQRERIAEVFGWRPANLADRERHGFSRSFNPSTQAWVRIDGIRHGWLVPPWDTNDGEFARSLYYANEMLGEQQKTHPDTFLWPEKT